MEQIVVCTAIFGPIKDVLQQPENQSSHVRFVAFVDDPSAGQLNGWLLRKAEFQSDDPRRRARQHKILSHKIYPDADVVLWVDGCLTPIQDVQALADQFLANHDLAVFEHTERGCIYKELEACIRLVKDIPDVMRRQVAWHRAEGYPYDNGLAETTALLRRHTKDICEFNETWWREVERGSVRDQLSFEVMMG